MHPPLETLDECATAGLVIDFVTALPLRGALISIDAMGCQKSIAAAIVHKQADYVLALKDNHPTLCEDVALWMKTQNEQGHVRVNETLEKDHGRIETRRTVVSTQLDWLEQRLQWAGLKALAMVESTRDMGNKISTERRYYLCSITKTERIAHSGFFIKFTGNQPWPVADSS